MALPIGASEGGGAISIRSTPRQGVTIIRQVAHPADKGWPRRGDTTPIQPTSAAYPLIWTGMCQALPSSSLGDRQGESSLRPVDVMLISCR